jgi:type II secretory pathway component PulC
MEIEPFRQHSNNSEMFLGNTHQILAIYYFILLHIITRYILLNSSILEESQSSNKRSFAYQTYNNQVTLIHKN